MGVGSRNEIKKRVKAGRITVNGQPIKNSGLQIHPNEVELRSDGELIAYREFIYVMMNKPPGVISATEDAKERTVVELLEESYRSFNLFPVGRLDKDTE